MDYGNTKTTQRVLKTSAMQWVCLRVEQWYTEAISNNNNTIYIYILKQSMILISFNTISQKKWSWNLNVGSPFMRFHCIVLFWGRFVLVFIIFFIWFCNQLNRKVYLGLYDNRTWPEPDSRDEQRVRDFMVQKYENKRFYVAPTEAMREEARRMNDAALSKQPQTKPLRALLGENATKLVIGNSQVGVPFSCVDLFADGVAVQSKYFWGSSGIWVHCVDFLCKDLLSTGASKQFESSLWSCLSSSSFIVFKAELNPRSTARRYQLQWNV